MLAMPGDNEDKLGSLDQLSELLDDVYVWYQNKRSLSNLEVMIDACQSTVPDCRNVMERMKTEVSGT